MNKTPEMKPENACDVVGCHIKKVVGSRGCVYHSYLDRVESDPVNNPSHYKRGGIEAIDVVEAFGLGFKLGNTIKYILRSDHKGNRKQDLQKAAWYLAREIEKCSNE
jgi:hypothetical protein